MMSLGLHDRPLVASLAIYGLLCGYLGAFACTPVQQTLVRDAAGALCSVVVQATDPKLEPLCTTAAELEAVLAEWLADSSSAARRVAPPAPDSALPFPSQDAIYEAVRARHVSRTAGSR